MSSYFHVIQSLYQSFWWLYQEHQLQLISLSLSYSTAFSILKVPISLVVFFQFYSVVSRDSKVHNLASSLFLVDYCCLVVWQSGCLAEIRWSVCISKSQRSLCISFSRTDSELCIYHLFIWSNYNFLHNSQWITLPIQLCLVLYSFCAILLNSLTMWLIILSLSPHNLYLLFCYILSILVLIWFLLMALFCAVISRDSVSPLNVSLFLATSTFSHVRCHLLVT